MKFKNLEVTYNDLNTMREFIELYEDIQNTCDEYNEICRTTRKKYNIKEKDLLPTLQNMISINILRKCNTTDEEYEMLNQEYKELTTKYNSLLPYKKIIEINNELDIITLREFTPKNIRIIENKTNSDEKERKYEESIQREKIEENKSLTIRQVYIKIKYLYELYELIYEYQNQTKMIEKIKRKRKIKQVLKLENDIEFFEMFKNSIEQINNNMGPRIIEAIKQSRKIVGEERIENITIIAPQYVKGQYTKTKSA